MLRRAYVKLHSAHEAGIMEDSIWGIYTWPSMRCPRLWLQVLPAEAGELCGVLLQAGIDMLAVHVLGLLFCSRVIAQCVWVACVMFRQLATC